MKNTLKQLDAPVLTRKDKELLLATTAASFIVVLAVLTISSIQVVERGAHYAAHTYTISLEKREG